MLSLISRSQNAFLLRAKSTITFVLHTLDMRLKLLVRGEWYGLQRRYLLANLGIAPRERGGTATFEEAPPFRVPQWTRLDCAEFTKERQWLLSQPSRS